ncbi:MAG: response regulator [Lachnospiraceae bacterium]|nr:response regulator [Lachnospiraceae bacterium]
MKKILFFGMFNEIMKDVNKYLSNYFHVQLCELNSDAVKDMLKVYEPDLAIIFLIGAKEYDTYLFGMLAKSDTPVLTIGTNQEKRAFDRFYEDGQFENLVRPVDNHIILSNVCRRLNLDLEEKDGKQVIADPNAMKNILIVDDDPTALRSIQEMLKEEFDVSLATSGSQAMTTIGKRRPDLILLDYEMPVCDGRQTLAMIRADEDLTDIPVIFLTGISDGEHIKAVLNLKPQGYLLKPASKNGLLKTIRKTINT